MSLSGKHLSFFVPGVPISQGSGMARRSRRGKLSVQMVTPKLEAWRTSIGMEAKRARAKLDYAKEWIGCDDPVEMRCEFYFEPIASHPFRDWRQTKPDLDKLVRAVGDALEISGVLKNDSRIVSLQACKMVGPSGVKVKLTRATRCACV